MTKEPSISRSLDRNACGGVGGGQGVKDWREMYGADANPGSPSRSAPLSWVGEQTTFHPHLVLLLGGEGLHVALACSIGRGGCSGARGAARWGHATPLSQCPTWPQLEAEDGRQHARLVVGARARLRREAT
jgi:hypothetical protein